ncbi:CHAD domain-containing protein [Methylomonas rapida]|uniref:CHAD domain-containing protein n=1 Tax=Methylomonas rapida TaxID=2963939 RepID=A0ABY7GMF7_9GAMM|nr:CHAD domain-containing protein [Methylomonas rapida]WAR45666.1 CHAD domain-containing protein [Methylomonas rapida]
MHDGKRLLHALDSLWTKYQKRLTDCHHRPTEEAVHKLRISTRRLLALIELLKTLSPHPSLQKLRKNLKTQLDAFDELRDTQVMLLEITAKQDSLPDLLPFFRQLQLNEQWLLAQTPARLQAIDQPKIHARFKKSHAHLSQTLGKAHLKPRILTVIDETYQAAMARYQAIDVAQPDTIHRLRIAVKKLRYMLEAGQALLPPLPEDHIEQLHAYLTRMGEFQDSSVLLLNLKAFFGEQVPSSIQSYYQHRHGTILSTFISKREHIKLFWRPSSKQAFPWESCPP